jgi:tether containing UBX domain for GLUT4
MLLKDVFLKTKKIRDAEAAAKRASITKVRSSWNMCVLAYSSPDRNGISVFFLQAVIRVLFPDNYFLEAKFQPSDSLSLLFDLLSKVVSRPDIPFYICKVFSLTSIIS